MTEPHIVLKTRVTSLQWMKQTMVGDEDDEEREKSGNEGRVAIYPQTAGVRYFTGSNCPLGRAQKHREMKRGLWATRERHRILHSLISPLNYQTAFVFYHHECAIQTSPTILKISPACIINTTTGITV